MRNAFICFFTLFLTSNYCAAQQGAADGHVNTSTSTLSGDTVFTMVEQVPEFPGGDAALIKFLS